MKQLLLILTISVLTFSSCKKEVTEVYPEFIGHWITGYSYPFYTIVIDEKGLCSYREYTSMGNAGSFSGKARANSTKLTVGRIHTFKIIEYPRRIDTNITKINIAHPSDNTRELANWRMELEGPSLYMGTGIYYKADY